MAFISVNPDALVKMHTYEGTASTNAQTGIDFQPDLVWLKNIDSAGDWSCYDAIRGSTKALMQDNNGEEQTYSTGLTSFDADGFTVGTQAVVNGSGHTIGNWNWKAGTTSGITTNGSTTITPSSYSFNTGAGFSILKYTGNGTSGAKLAHGLGGTPDFYMIKDITNANNWRVYHVGINGSGYSSQGDYQLTLDDTSARDDQPDFTNDTVPDAVNISLGDQGKVNSNATTYICYAWRNIKGLSQFGYSSANGEVNGNFHYTSFRPAMVLYKKYSSTSGWLLYSDQLGSPWNVDEGVTGTTAYQEVHAAGTNQTDKPIHIFSNGFKVVDGAAEVNSGSYVWCAWAAQPLVSSTGTPATAR